MLSFSCRQQQSDYPMMKTNMTTNMNEAMKFEYYTGDRALGLDPSAGTWVGNVFISPDGKQWVMCDPYDDCSDGTGIVYLKPALAQVDAVSLVLNHKNWTGLTLRELVDAGRIQADDQGVIRDFTKAALGEPKDMDEWHEQREITALVVFALQGFAIRKEVA